ncbi:hypothetical protein Pelo_5263 [Pelomyxa schiedti]|nr:hypothetical protein Pelo_5263 [Pelomyxa schiedti]
MHNHYQSSRSIPIILDGVSLSSVQKDSLLATLTELVISPSPVSTFSRTADPAVLGRMVKIGVVYIHDGAYAFSSPLIQNICIQKEIALHHAIAEFDPKVLADTQSKSSKDGYPLESCYLVELYRTLSCLLPTNVSVSTNVGCGGAAATGYIDLLINTTSLRWGIEVLREGTDAGMREHRKRFISDAYSAFPFTDWVVIDFRCTERTTPIPDHTMVVVFCLETFTSARVFSANGVRELRVAGLRALSPVDYL